MVHLCGMDRVDIEVRAIDNVDEVMYCVAAYHSKERQQAI